MYPIELTVAMVVVAAETADSFDLNLDPPFLFPRPVHSSQPRHQVGSKDGSDSQYDSTLTAGGQQAGADDIPLPRDRGAPLSQQHQGGSPGSQQPSLSRLSSARPSTLTDTRSSSETGSASSTRKPPYTPSFRSALVLHSSITHPSTSCRTHHVLPARPGRPPPTPLGRPAFVRRASLALVHLGLGRVRPGRVRLPRAITARPSADVSRRRLEPQGTRAGARPTYKGF